MRQKNCPPPPSFPLSPFSPCLNEIVGLNTVHIYEKLGYCIQLSPAFTELCHTERDRLLNRVVNFYISLEKRQTGPIVISLPFFSKFGKVVQKKSRVHRPIKMNF